MNGPRVLMACGSPETAQTFRQMLAEFDCFVEEAASSSAAMEKAQTDQGWDVIFLDAKMTDAGSFAACRELSDNSLTAHMPVIMVAFGEDPVNFAKRSEDSGALAWLPAGFSQAELRLCLQISRQLSGGQDGASATEVDAAFLENVSKLSHAVNNPLQALYAAGDLLMLELEGNENAASLVQDMLANAQRVAELVSQVSMEAKRIRGDDS